MKKTPHRGFTLIETLIVLLIFMLIVLAIIKLYTTYDVMFRTEQSTIDVDDSAAQIEDAVNLAASQATAIEASYAISGTTYTTSSTTLVLQLPSVNSSGSIISNSYDYVALYASSTNAYEVTSAASGSARQSGTSHLSDAVSDLSFLYNNGTPSAATDVETFVRTQKTQVEQTAQDTVSETSYLWNQ